MSTVLASLTLTCSASLLGGCSGGGSNQTASSSSSGGTGGHGGAGVGGQDGAGGHSDGGAALCADRTKGALVTFDIAGESLTLWITSGAFIDEAKMLLAQGTQKVPVFEQVIDGQDCDPKWTFHVDPAQASFADVTIELCDGKPSYIEGDTASWIAQVKSYCPWSAKVTAVEDRRGP